MTVTVSSPSHDCKYWTGCIMHFSGIGSLPSLHVQVVEVIVQCVAIHDLART